MKFRTICAYLFSMSLACLCAFTQGAAFNSQENSGADVHGEITRSALRGTISDTNLDFLIKAEQSQDNPKCEGSDESRRHFDEANFVGALAYMDREKKSALNYAADADADAQNRAQCLRHLGLMLHTAQDFYSRTNYVELQLENPARVDSPFDLPLVDWLKVPSGYLGASSGKSLTSASSKTGNVQKTSLSSLPGYEEFNKDSATTAEGKKAVGSTTYFQIAKDLAVRETERQWNLFEALVRARYGAKSEAILSALKSGNIDAGSAPDASPDSIME